MASRVYVQQHQGWVNDSLGERNCSSNLSEERWSYCCAMTFGPTAHCILQLLPLSCGATMDDCSWKQRQKLALMHFLLKFCTSLSCQWRKNEKKRRSQSAPWWNMALIGIYMFAKALREITTKPEYNVKMISSDNPFSYLKKIETLYWEVFHLREQKNPLFMSRSEKYHRNDPWQLNAKMSVQLRSRDQVNAALAAVNGPSVSE